MKSKITVVLAILLLITLSGCNNTPQTEKTPEPYSSSESNQNASDEDTLPADETNEVDTTPEAVQSSEPSETQSAEEAGGTESSEPKAPEITAEPTSALQDEPTQKTENEAVQATAPEKETPPPAPSEQTEAAESEPLLEIPPEPKSIYDFEFDIAAIRADLISVGEAMGLTHTDGLTPDTASWSTPITASADFQGENLERRLKDYVQSMPELITAYGGNPIQTFTIYTEPLGGGSYRIYFLY